MEQPPRLTSVVPAPVYRVSSLTYLSLLIAGLFYHLVNPGADRLDLARLGAFTGVLVLLVALERFGQRRFSPATARRAAVALLAMRMLAFEAVAAVDPAGFSRVLGLLIPFNAYFCLGKRASYSLAFVYLAVYLARLSIAVPAWYVGREYLSGLFMFCIGLIFTLSMADSAADAEASRGRAERLLSELETSHQQLKTYAEQAAGLAAAEERNRLARDIHDTLGHYLTAISVQLEKATAFQRRDPQEAEQALWHAKSAARQALQEVRQSVSALRHSAEPFSLSLALAELVRHLDSDRFALRLQISGEELGFPQVVQLSLYRAAQEALTNIQKHAQASAATIQIVFGAQEVRCRSKTTAGGLIQRCSISSPPGGRHTLASRACASGSHSWREPWPF